MLKNMDQSMQFFMAILLTSLLAKVKMSLVISECFDWYEENLSDYKVSCSKNSQNLDYTIGIHCNGHLLADIFNITIKLFPVSWLIFSDCSFSRTFNIQTIVNSMNVVYDRISFFNFYGMPYRFNFRNLSTPMLGFSETKIIELPYDFLYDVTDIRSLRIFHTKIIRIPQDFFADWAQNISEVSIFGNKLKKVAKQDFSRLVNLITLNLALNEIEEIESGAFDNLIHLDELILSTNRLHVLPTNIFHKLVSLTKINLDSRPFHRYLQNPPKDEKNLTIFQLQSLAFDLFHNASKLRAIEIGGHDIKNLPLRLFDNNKNLEKLRLDKNLIESLPPGIFKNLESLKYLHLEKNQLTALRSEDFVGLHSLQFLDVSKNKLSRIDVRLLIHLKSATHIDVSYNQIANLEYANEGKRQDFRHLAVVNFSSNSFTEFNIDFVNLLSYSQVFDLSNNHISRINLTGISVQMVKVDTFNIENTEIIENVKVYLCNNLINCDCHLVDFVRYLNRFSHEKLEQYVTIYAQRDSPFGKGFTCTSPPEFKHRDVRDIPFEEFNCLVESNMHSDACNGTCICREFPEKYVLSIDCSHKNLSQLPVIVNNEKNFSIELNMSGNALKSTPSLNHSYLIAVTKLDLSSNNITEVSLDSFSPSLQELKLHNNSISRLNRTVFEYLARDNSLSSMTIYDNKWICDCETYKLLQGFNKNQRSSYNFNEMLCYGTNRTIYEIAESELCENTSVFIVVASSLIAFCGILMGCLAGLYYRYQQQIKIWLYSRNLCLRFITDDELDKDKQYDAFISFSHKDEDFVEKEIVAKLEEGPRPYKLCLHYRDWLAGEWIPLQISRSVADSRRTIIILTPNFLESVWGLIEFRTAHTQALKDGRTRLIVILHGEIDPEDLDQELKDYLSLNTYIKWGDSWFWQKLKYALPHRLKIFKDTNFDPLAYRMDCYENTRSIGVS